MLTQHVYAVKRHNEFLPMPKSSRGRGGSYLEPIDPRLAWPRVFREAPFNCYFDSAWSWYLPEHKQWGTQ